MAHENRDFSTRLSQIKDELVAQGERVVDLVERGFDAFFASDLDAAKAVVEGDEPIDRADLAIEAAAIDLLSDAGRESNELATADIRLLLVVVKVNNELERIADASVDIAQEIDPSSPPRFPETFRVVTNSVVGIVRDAVACLDQGDASLAKLVLQSEDCVREFKSAMLRDAASGVTAGSLPVDRAFVLHEVASLCVVMADHATNIAEQVIYATTGKVVRHDHGKWVEVPKSDAS